MPLFLLQHIGHRCLPKERACAHRVLLLTVQLGCLVFHSLGNAKLQPCRPESHGLQHLLCPGELKCMTVQDFR